MICNYRHEFLKVKYFIKLLRMMLDVVFLVFKLINYDAHKKTLYFIIYFIV